MHGFRFFGLPSRGSFHRSLALLSSLSVAREYLALGRGRPGFTPSFPSWALLENARKEESKRFAYGAVTLYGPTFLTGSATLDFSDFPPGVGSRTHASRDPRTATHPRLTRCRFRLFRVRSPLLTESMSLSLPAGTKMFQFPALAPFRVARHKPCRVSPFGNPRIKACSAAPRGLSQPATSFIAFWRQGIPHAPLVAWPFHQISIRFFGRTGSLPMNGLRESAQHSNVLDFGSHLSENPSTRRDTHGVSRTRSGQAPAVGADRRPIQCASKITPPA